MELEPGDLIQFGNAKKFIFRVLTTRVGIPTSVILVSTDGSMILEDNYIYKSKIGWPHSHFTLIEKATELEKALYL